MEGENFPFFFVPSLTFPISNPLNDNISSTDNYNDPPTILNQSMQNPELQCHSSDQIDLSGLLFAGSAMNERNPNSSTVSNTVQVREAENNISTRNKSRLGKRKKYVPPRVAFHTRSDEDILDDGYKWRKYGQKSVKHSVHPRSYYRCTHHTCNVKKQIQRLSNDTSVVVTTYEGIHNHPCEKLMETLSPLLKQLQFLTRF